MRGMLNASFGIGDGAEVLSQTALTLVDTDARKVGADVGALHTQLRAAAPTAVILCCSLEEPNSFVRAASYWLPALEAFSRVDDGRQAAVGAPLAVLLCGTKSDTLDAESCEESTRAAWVAAARGVLAAIGGDAGIEEDIAGAAAEDLRIHMSRLLMQRFPVLQGAMKVCACGRGRRGVFEEETGAARLPWTAATGACPLLFSPLADLCSLCGWPQQRRGHLPHDQRRGGGGRRLCAGGVHGGVAGGAAL